MSDPMVLPVYQYVPSSNNGKLKASGQDLTVSVVLEVEKLIIPLGHDPYCILDECADDEESSSCWYVSTTSTPLNQRKVSSSTPGICTRQHSLKTTHCFIGSAAVSNQSSILLVCSLSCSSGLGSLVASALPGPPNRLSCEPRL